MPICNIVLKGLKPNRQPYPKELVTYGDHIRKRRLDLDLSQPQVAQITKVETDTVTNWELNRNEPQVNHLPKIISFLGYIPKLDEDNLIKEYRIKRGLSQKEMAKTLQINPATLSSVERGKGKRTNKNIQIKLDELLNS